MCFDPIRLSIPDAASHPVSVPLNLGASSADAAQTSQGRVKPGAGAPSESWAPAWSAGWS